MDNTNISTFDKSEQFAAVQKQLDDIALYCSVHKIPFFYSACVANDAQDGSRYVSNAVSAREKNLHLVEDKISKYLSCVAGFDVVTRRDDIMIDMMDDSFGLDEGDDEVTY